MQPVTQMLFRGHAFISSILFNNPLVSRRQKCVCLCVCFCGAPWGEAGQSLPVAALGQDMAIQDTCLATGPNIILAPFVFSLPLHTFPSPAMYSDPRFNPSVPKSPFLCHLHTYFCNLFNKIVVIPSLCHPRSLSTSVFWQGCISSLAVLLGGEGGGGGVPRDVRVH